MRPKLDPDSPTVRVTYSITEAQKARLSAYADAKGLRSPSEALREILESLGQSYDDSAQSYDETQSYDDSNQSYDDSNTPCDGDIGQYGVSYDETEVGFKQSPSLTLSSLKCLEKASKDSERPDRNQIKAQSQGLELTDKDIVETPEKLSTTKCGEYSAWSGTWPPPKVESADADRLAELAVKLRKAWRPRTHGKVSRWRDGIAALLTYGPQAQKGRRVPDPDVVPEPDEVEAALRAFYTVYKPSVDLDWHKHVNDGQGLWRLWRTWSPTMLELYDGNAATIHPEGFWPDILELARLCKSSPTRPSYPSTLPASWARLVDEAVGLINAGRCDDARARFLTSLSQNGFSRLDTLLGLPISG